MKPQQTTQQKIQKMAILSIFAAIAFVTPLVFRVRIQFLTFDIKDALICICAMSMGPVSGIIVSLLVAFIEMVTISDTLLYGFFMNFLSSATFATVASLLYRKSRNLYGAILALLCAAISTVAVMLTFNLLVTPLYLDTTRAFVADMILPTLLPFNAVKTVVNAGFTMLLYKPVTQAMVKAKVYKKSQQTSFSAHKTLLVSLASVLVIVAAICVCVYVLGGKINFFKL